jgi:hypothetical protein
MIIPKILLPLFLLHFVLSSSGQTNQQKKCMTKWTYLKTAKSIHRRLIHFSPVAGCGYFITATLSIVKTDKGDIIRVLQLCDTTNKVVLNSKVTLLPTPKLNHQKASIIPEDPTTDCTIRNTIMDA